MDALAVTRRFTVKVIDPPVCVSAFSAIACSCASSERVRFERTAFSPAAIDLQSRRKVPLGSARRCLAPAPGTTATLFFNRLSYCSIVNTRSTLPLRMPYICLCRLMVPS